MLDCYEVVDVVVTTSGTSGSAELAQPLSGRIVQIDYAEDGDSPLTDGATFKVEVIRPGGGSELEIFQSEAGDLNDHNSFLPEFPTRANDGSLSGGGDYYLLVGEKLRFTVEDAGEAEIARFSVKVAK